MAFTEQLTKLKKAYPQNPSTIDARTCALIEGKLQLILQNHLWEGRVVKQLNKVEYKKLSLKWHPDKIDSILTSEDASPETDFVKWFASLKFDNQAETLQKDNLFKVLGKVKEKYDPALGVHVDDNNPMNFEAEDRPFFLFNAIATISPTLYNLLFPIFYILEKLEQNIQNYENPDHKKLANKLYIGCCLAPFFISMFLLKLELKDLHALANAISPAFAVIATTTVGYIVQFLAPPLMTIYIANVLYNYKWTPEDTFTFSPNENIFYTLLISTPLKMLKALWKGLYDHNKDFSNWKEKLKHYAIHGSVFVVIAAYSISQLVLFANAVTYGAVYIAGFTGVFFTIPVIGVIVANAPLLLSTCIFSPKEALNSIKNTGLDIGIFYINHVRNLFSHVQNFVQSYVNYLSAKFGRKQQQKQPQPDIEQPVPPKQKQQQPEEQPIDPQPSIPKQQQPVTLPYWKLKLNKYLQKPTEVLEDKSRSVKKARNTILKSMGANQDNAIFDTLDEEVNIRSVKLDENGHVVNNVPENMVDSLSILNYKAQAVYFKSCQDKQKPLNLAIKDRPKDLDYHSLIQKPVKLARS